jgi:hypothetical protein
MLEKMIAEPAVSGPEFQQVNGFFLLPSQGQIPQKSQDQLRIGFTHDGIAGDVVGHFATAPGIDACAAEIVALELPDQALSEALLFLD